MRHHALMMKEVKARRVGTILPLDYDISWSGETVQIRPFGLSERRSEIALITDLLSYGTHRQEPFVIFFQRVSAHSKPRLTGVRSDRSPGPSSSVPCVYKARSGGIKFSINDHVLDAIARSATSLRGTRVS